MKTILVLAVCSLAISNSWGQRALHAMDTCTKPHYRNYDDVTPEKQLDWLQKYGYAGIAWTDEEPAQVAKVAAAAAERGVPMTAIFFKAKLTPKDLETGPHFRELLDALKPYGTLIWVDIESSSFPKSDTAGDAIAVPALREMADLAAERKIETCNLSTYQGLGRAHGRCHSSGQNWWRGQTLVSASIFVMP